MSESPPIQEPQGPPTDAERFVAAYESWLRDQSITSLLPKDELRALVDELRANDSLWESKRPRYEELWAKGDERLRKEERSLKQLLSEKAIARLVEGAEGFEPDPEALRTFLRSPAIEAMLGEILYQGISEFIRKADLIGRVINKLPVLGPIRRRIMSAFRAEIESRLEGQIKGFLGGFSGLAVERMIGFVLSDENREGFRKARRRLAEHMTERPIQSLVPSPEDSTRARDQVWTGIREAKLPDEDELLDEAYGDHGEDALGTWTIELSRRARILAAAPLERFLAGGDWTLSDAP